MRFKDFVNKNKAPNISDKVTENVRLDEGRKYIDVNSREKIGIDQPHQDGQQVLGHLESGRAVNKDGSLSHGGKPFYLTRAQADALRRADFTIAKSRLVENEGGTNSITIELDQEVLLMLIDLQGRVC